MPCLRPLPRSQSAAAIRTREPGFRREWLRCTSEMASARVCFGVHGAHLQAQFPRRPLSAQTLSEFQFLTGAACRAQELAATQSRKIQGGAKLSCREAQQSPLHGRGKLGKPRHIQSRARSPQRRPPPRTGRPGKRICGASLRHFRLPPGFFVARKGCHLRHMLAQSRVPALEQRQQLMPDAVAAKGQMHGSMSPPASSARARADKLPLQRAWSRAADAESRPSGNTSLG